MVNGKWLMGREGDDRCEATNDPAFAEATAGKRESGTDGTKDDGRAEARPSERKRWPRRRSRGKLAGRPVRAHRARQGRQQHARK